MSRGLQRRRVPWTQELLALQSLVICGRTALCIPQLPITHRSIFVGCRKLKALQSLEVCGGGVTDSGVACLQDLSQLRSLSLAQVYLANMATNTARLLINMRAGTGCHTAQYLFHSIPSTWAGTPACMLSAGLATRALLPVMPHSGTVVFLVE